MNKYTTYCTTNILTTSLAYGGHTHKYMSWLFKQWVKDECFVTYSASGAAVSIPNKFTYSLALHIH